jgi:hypothetical protein
MFALRRESTSTCIYNNSPNKVACIISNRLLILYALERKLIENLNFIPVRLLVRLPVNETANLI